MTDTHAPLALPAGLETLRADPAQSIVGRAEAFYQAACPEWDSDLGEAFRLEFEFGAPTLIVHGTWDTSTPYENALELLPAFVDAAFVTVEGAKPRKPAAKASIASESMFSEPPLSFSITAMLMSPCLWR